MSDLRELFDDMFGNPQDDIDGITKIHQETNVSRRIEEYQDTKEYIQHQVDELYLLERLQRVLLDAYMRDGTIKADLFAKYITMFNDEAQDVLNRGVDKDV